MGTIAVRAPVFLRFSPLTPYQSTETQIEIIHFEHRLVRSDLRLPSHPMDSASTNTYLADPNAKSLDEMQVSVNNALGALHLVIQAIEDRMREMERELKCRRDSLDSKTQAYYTVREEMRKSIAQRKNKVKFNVGGKIFAIEKQDIMRHEDSLFYYMLCTDIWSPDDDGKI